MSESELLLELKDLQVCFRTEAGITRAVDGVSLEVAAGETLCVVGESGCGKSMTALSILRLVPSPPGEISRGSIRFKGRELLELSSREMQQIRGGEIAMIFQEPMTSLNPVFTVGDQIMEAIRGHRRDMSRREARGMAIEALGEVGIPVPEQRFSSYPHQLSGGMKQRVMIAMALVCRPSLLIADEPTTALDVTIQAQILELLRRLRHEYHMGMILITHDLGIVAENADQVVVMYAGRVAEYTTVQRLFENPKHPYTVGLFKSLPSLGARQRALEVIPGMVPNAGEFPDGCRFRNRCERAKDVCSTQPPLDPVEPGHFVACHLVSSSISDL